MKQKIIFTAILAILICVSTFTAGAVNLKEDLTVGINQIPWEKAVAESKTSPKTETEPGADVNPGREENVKIFIDDKEMEDGGLSYIEYGVTYAPFDKLTCYLGATFTSWDKGDKNVAISAPGVEIKLDETWNYIEANGRCLYFPGAYREENGILMVPVRRICEAFGADISWNEELCAVDIKKTGEPIMSGDEFYDENDLYWLSRIIYSESRGEVLEGQIAVGNVVLNRMNSESFPDTIKGVIFDKSGGVQFSPAYSGAIYMRPDAASVAAAKLVLEGIVVTEDALYFIPNRFAETCWASRNRPYDMCIGGHTFFA